MHRTFALAVPVVVPLLLASCGGAPAPAAPPAPTSEPTAAPSAEPAPEAEKHADKLPTSCSGGDDKICMPPADFVKRLCGGFFPDVALSMLSKGTPWTRGYLRVKSTEAWNASGGVSSSDKVVFDEEFVILTHRKADAGGMQVSGAGGGYDVLRWDGTCASLMDEEVTLKTPPAPKSAKIPWKSLDDKVRDALLADEKVNKVYTERRKECKGATIGDVSLKCEKVDAQLSVVIADFVRNGGSLPPPPKLP
jgi:hypothetical protein